jgi:hypothetical protein
MRFSDPLDAPVGSDSDAGLGEVVASLAVDTSADRNRRSAGLSLPEIAKQVGLPRRNVEERLDDLALELIDISELSR